MDTPFSLRKYLFFITACVVFILISFCDKANAINLPPSAKLLPPETIFVVDVPIFEKLEANYKKTNLYKLYKDPQMAAFVENAKVKWKKTLEGLDDNNIAGAIADCGIWPKGRLTIAFVDIEKIKDLNEPPMLLISQWGEKIGKIKEAIAKVSEKNIEMGGRKKPDINFQNVKILTAIDEKNTPFGYCFIDDVFIASTSVEAVKFTVAHIKGATSPTLSNDNNYISSSKAVGMQKDAAFYINLPYLIKSEIKKDTQGQLQTQFSNLGFDKIGGLAAGLIVAPAPTQVYNLKMLLKVNGSKTGVLKALEPKTAAYNIPRFIPADTASVGLFNFDAGQCFNELIKILTLFNPGVASILYNPLTPPSSDGSPGLTVKADIIDHLSTGVVVVQSLNKPFSQKTLPSDYMVGIATSNRNAIEKSLSAIHNQFIAVNDPEAKKELLGHTIYLVNFGRLPFLNPGGKQPLQQTNEEKPVKPAMPNIAFTVTDTHVLLGFESSIEKAIRTLRASSTLKEQRWFNQARASIPSQVGLANFENTRATGEFLWWLLKKSKENLAGAGMSAPMASYLIDDMDLDYSLLPEYDKVEKYLGTAIIHLISREDGFYAEAKMINQR